MSAIEFTTELSDKPVLTVPREIADQLPKSGKAKVIVITNGSAADDEWQAARTNILCEMMTLKMLCMTPSVNARRYFSL